MFRKQRRWISILPLLFFFIILSIDSTLLILTHTGWDASQSYYIPLRDKLARSRFALAESHLWLEEYLDGDETIDPQVQILNPVMSIILDAKTNNNLPVDSISKYSDTQTRDYFLNIETQLEQYYQVMLDRMNNKDTQGIGSIADNAFDALFHDVEGVVHAEITRVYQKMVAEAENRHRFFILAFIIFLSTNLLAFFALIYYRKDKFQYQTALNEQKELAETTLASIGDAVITTDAEGNVTSMNPVAEQLTGWSLIDAQGQTVKTILSIIDASNRETIENPVEKVLASGETVYLSNHTTLISKDGTEYQIADSAAPIRNRDDQIVGMVLVFNDVTNAYQMREENHRSQRALIAKEREQREILNNIVDAVITIDEAGIITTVNQTAVTLFGYIEEKIIGKNIKQLMPASYSEHNDGYLELYLKTGEAQVIDISRDVLGLHKDNTTFDMRFSIAELTPDESGKRRFIVSCQDMRQIKLQEEQLRRSQKMDALGKLTGGIAHDYNNMLGIVLGYAELLQGKLNDQPELNNYLNQIIHASERGAKLTSKLLSFSRQNPQEEKKLDINALIQAERDMLTRTLTVRIALVLDLEETLWPVYLDDGELEDTVLNMSINAMHAMQDKGTLTIRTSNQTLSTVDAITLNLKPGDYVQLSLTDTGCGMDQATKDKIFDPFFTTKGEHGTGLGLTQVFGFVSRAGGAIKVYSELDHGSQFILYFPRYVDNAQTTTNNNNHAADIRGHETLLIVDDEQGLHKLCAAILSPQGYTVFTAENGVQALIILEQEKIDLMLTDLIMPEMDGYELAAIVKEKYPAVKIQLASGFADERHKSLIDEQLQANLLHKPYNAKILLATIRNLLDS